MKKSEVIRSILQEREWQPASLQGEAFAPTNIALCKYWGKRDTELNLPVTSSLSIALPNKGAKTIIRISNEPQDVVTLNGKLLAADSGFVRRLSVFLDLFRQAKSVRLTIDIQMNLPVAAGLASSACGFASVVLALNDLFAWQLSSRDLSILARLGSGSAARSLWNGFVEWQVGVKADGMDSYAIPLNYIWPTFCVGVLSFSTEEKSISSRDAMQQTVASSLLYSSWPDKVASDMNAIKNALAQENFPLLGSAAESNALAMHATMQSSWPPICYSLPETLAAMHKVWELRKQGLSVYFTQDAGPNLKLLFLEKDTAAIKVAFPMVEVISCFK